MEKGTVSSEEEATDIIRQSLGAQDETTSNTILFRDVRHKLIEMNREDMPLPEEFLKRWVEVGHQKEAPSILNNFDDFADDMRWTLIKQKLYKKFEIKLENEDLRKAASSKVMGYFGGQMQPGMEEVVKNIVDRMLEDPNQMENLAS